MALNLGGSLNFLIAAFAGGFLSRLIPLASTQGKEVGNSVGQLIVNKIEADMPATLRPLVITELKSIAASATASSQTVIQTSEAILTKVIPQVPQATIAQIATIVGEFVLTFEAGLTAALDAAS